MINVALGFCALGTAMTIALATSATVRSVTALWALQIYFAGMAIATFQLGINDGGLDQYHVTVYRWIQASWAFIAVASIFFAVLYTRNARAERRATEQKQREAEGWQWW